MLETPVGSGWVQVGDLVVVAPRPPYQDVPLSESERPTSEAAKVVLCEGVELRVEAVRGARARVSGIAADVEGWIRLCASDGTPLVQPLWLARQSHGAPPGTAAAVAGTEGTERDLEALLEMHGLSVPGRERVLALQRLLRYKEAALQPEKGGGLALHADCAVVQITTVAGAVLVETHREVSGAAVAVGRLPQRLRRAGEEWEDTASRAMSLVFGVPPQDLVGRFHFEVLPEPVAHPLQPLPGLAVHGSIRRVVCRPSPASDVAHSAWGRALSMAKGVPPPFATLDAEEGPEVCRYWSWRAEALHRAMESGCGDAEDLAAFGAAVPWLVRAVLGTAGRDVQPGAHRFEVLCFGGARPTLILATPRGTASSASVAVLRIAACAGAGAVAPRRDLDRDVLVARSLGEPCVHPSGDLLGQAIELPGAAWLLPELAGSAAPLLSTLQSLLRSIRVPGPAGAWGAPPPRFLAELGARLGSLAGSPGAPSRLSARCAEDVFALFADVLEDPALPPELASAWRAFREDAGYSPLQWRPLAAYGGHGTPDASQVLVDIRFSVWLPGGSSRQMPALSDLACLAASIILEGALLPLSASDFVLLVCGARPSAEEVASWLGVSLHVAQRLLRAAASQSASADLGRARSQAEALAVEPHTPGTAAPLEMHFAASEDTASALAAAEVLSSEFVSRLPRWGAMRGRHGPEGFEDGSDDELAVPELPEWAAALYTVTAEMLAAAATSYGAALAAIRREGAASLQIDTSPLLLLLPMLCASKACLLRAPPWQRPWVERTRGLLAAQAAKALQRARSAMGPEWSPLWSLPRASASALPPGVSFAPGMRALAAPRPRGCLGSGASEDPGVDIGVYDGEEGPLLLGWPCASEGLSLEEGWQLSQGAVRAPEAPKEALREWAAASASLDRSCAFRHILSVSPEGDFTIEELPPSRRDAGGAVEVVFQGCRLGSARLREGVLRLRLDQRTLCSPPCQISALTYEVVELDLGGRRLGVVLRLSAPFFWYPPGARVAAQAASGRLACGLREATVVRHLGESNYEVRFDGGCALSSVRLGLEGGAHRPAAVYRYAAGSRLVVYDDTASHGRWRDAVVQGRGAGNQHFLMLAGMEEASAVDLNTGNHTPAWLRAAAFERALADHTARLLTRCASSPAPLGGRPLDVLAQLALLSPAHPAGGADAWGRLRDSLLRPPHAARREGSHPAGGAAFAVSGGPGSGKTALVRRIAAMCIRAGSGWLPVLLSGGDVAAALIADPGLTGDLLPRLAELPSGGLEANPVLLRQAMYSRRCLVLLDDLEASDRMRLRVEAYLLRLARAGHWVLYTTSARPPKAPQDAPFEHLRLLPLEAQHVRSLVESRLPGASSRFLADVAPAAGNPLALQMLLGADLKEGGSYATAISAALLRAGLRVEAVRALEVVAFEAQRRRLGGPCGFREADFRGVLRSEEAEAWSLIRGASREGALPLLRWSGEELRFAHLSFQEYLCAARLARAPAGAPALRTLLSEAWWAQCMEFLASCFRPECGALLRSGAAAWQATSGPLEVTPLHLAVEGSLTQVVELLLEQGLPASGVQHRNRHMYGAVEETPLACACARSCAIAAALIASGAEVQGWQSKHISPDGDCKERTPLFCAVERGHTAVVELLLRHGAICDGPQYRETTAGRGRTRGCLDAAGTEEMRALLLAAGASGRPLTGR